MSAPVMVATGSCQDCGARIDMPACEVEHEDGAIVERVWCDDCAADGSDEDWRGDR